MSMVLHCYCCGEPIKGYIALVTMSSFPVDRVFTANTEHLENFDDATTNSMVVQPYPQYKANDN